MDKYKTYNYLFNKNCLKEEFLFVLEQTKPIDVYKLNFIKTENNFDLGEFHFYFKGINKKEFKISFYNESENLNDLWKFLEKLIGAKQALILPLLHNGEEIILYIEPMDKSKVRFVVMNTINISRKYKEGKVLRYSYKDSETDLDVIITKRRLIRQFYNILRDMFIKFDNIAYFEPPYIDYNFWIKDSTKIKNFLKTKMGGKNSPR